jgi:hypothetical protein
MSDLSQLEDDLRGMFDRGSRPTGHCFGGCTRCEPERFAAYARLHAAVVGQRESAENAGLRARVEALAAGWEDYAAKIPGEHLHIERKTLMRCNRELRAALADGGGGGVGGAER